MKTIEKSTGAIIGKRQASTPFVKLAVSKTKLEINASILGNLLFSPQDISSFVIESSGLRLKHTVEQYHENVVISSASPKELVEAIEATGFLDRDIEQKDNPDYEQIRSFQQEGATPFKKSFLVTMLILWNVLFLLDLTTVFDFGIHPFPFGHLIISAFGLFFISALSVLLIGSVRKLVLKEGRRKEDVERFLYVAIFGFGFMLMVFGSFVYGGFFELILERYK